MKILAKKLTNKVPIFINADDFAKCSAAQTLLNPCAETSLRANRRFFRFARKCQPSVTGKTLILGILPVNASPTLRAKCRFLGFARKIKPSVTGKTLILGICP